MVLSGLNVNILRIKSMYSQDKNLCPKKIFF